MNFKKAKWVEWENGHSVANMAFGIQLAVYEYDGKWIWKMGNVAFTFKQGKSKNAFVAKANAQHAFYLYVQENLEKCIERESI